MEVIICPTPHDVGAVAAARFARTASRVGPHVVFGVATGSTPVDTFTQLSARVRSGDVDLRQASAFALDEYVGLPPGHPESYHEVIRRTVTEPLGLDPERVHIPDGYAVDLEAACVEFEDEIAAAGGVDIQILGLGTNGHIGFNEPTSSLSSRTRIKTLSVRTRADNARFFTDPDEVPRHSITQGLGTIMEAREILLVATGRAKAGAVARVVEGAISAMWPGSVLQIHPNATVVVDEGAASQLALSEYYRETYANLPPWQRVHA